MAKHSVRSADRKYTVANQHRVRPRQGLWVSAEKLAGDTNDMELHGCSSLLFPTTQLS